MGCASSSQMTRFDDAHALKFMSALAWCVIQKIQLFCRLVLTSYLTGLAAALAP